MKRILFILSVFAFFLAGCSSDPIINKAFSKYSGRKGVTSVTVPGFAVHAATWFADLEPQEEKLLQKVDLVKVLVIEDESNFSKANFQKEFSRYLTGDYQLLLSVKDDSDDIKILAKMKNEEDITDLLIIAGGNDNAMIYVKGNFNLTEIAEETDFLKGKSLHTMFSMK